MCRQLGYNGTIRASTNAEFGQGTGTIWMNNVGCTGSESSLDQCLFNGWGINDCEHDCDAGVMCQGNMMCVHDVCFCVDVLYLYTVCIDT